MEFWIRKATLRDMNAVVENWIALMETHYSYSLDIYRVKRNYVAIYKRFLKKQIASEKSAVFVAEAKGGIVGHAMVEKKKLPKVYLTDKEAYVGELFVRKPFRGNRIGTALLEQAEKWAKENKLSQFSLTSDVRNRRALRTYRKFGLIAHQFKLTKKLR